MHSDDSSSSSDDDSQDDEEKILYNYDQQDPMDNLVDAKMLKEYIKGQEGAAPLEYGTHLTAVRYLNA